MATMSHRPCKRCGTTAPVKARGLCSPCYGRARAAADLDAYPTMYAFTPGADCRCANPIPDPIPLFHAMQCGRCGKRLDLSEGAK